MSRMRRPQVKYGSAPAEAAIEQVVRRREGGAERSELQQASQSGNGGPLDQVLIHQLVVGSEKAGEGSTARGNCRQYSLNTSVYSDRLSPSFLDLIFLSRSSLFIIHPCGAVSAPTQRTVIGLRAREDTSELLLL